MNSTYDYQEVQCGVCFMHFQITKQLYDARSLDGNTFWCPVGHTCAWPNKRAVDKDKKIATLQSEVVRLAIALEQTEAKLEAVTPAVVPAAVI